jgi:ABC-2 type transport system permease protein
MTLSWSRIRTVARRDYLSTVRRRAFLFTLVGTPMLYALLFFVVLKPQMQERVSALRAFTALGVVDSSGLFGGASREVWTEITPDNPFGNQEPRKSDQFRTEVKTYADQPAGEAALRSGEIHQLLVVPRDYAHTGALRRYANKDNLFTASDQRVVTRWLVHNLLRSMDSTQVELVTQPLRREALYALNRDGHFELKNEARETLDFLLPFALGLLLGLAIVIGGQYLLQGVTEEKESRILESMLCNVSPEELLCGKLLGLGGAGLTLVGGWNLLIVLVMGFAAPALGVLRVSLPPGVIALMITYFLLGYLFYGSLMTGIGAIASNMREAQQFSVWFTFMNFVPFYLLSTLIGHPESPLAVTLSMIPFTAPVASMLRLAAPSAHVPGWQVATSITLLAGSAFGVLILSARLFRIGMLMYGKTPNLPEIVRWIRQA